MPALTEMDLQFNFQSDGAPVTMTVDEYARQIIAFQAEQADTAATKLMGRPIVMNSVLGRMEEDTKVDVDTELAKLLEIADSLFCQCACHVGCS